MHILSISSYLPHIFPIYNREMLPTFFFFFNPTETKGLKYFKILYIQVAANTCPSRSLSPDLTSFILEFERVLKRGVSQQGNVCGNFLKSEWLIK